MAKCDICGATAPVHEMEDLLDIYRTTEIQSMCRPCSAWANTELWRIRGENATTLKTRICERAGRKKKVGLLSRLFNRLAQQPDGRSARSKPKPDAQERTEGK